jgi:hypothetical protein
MRVLHAGELQSLHSLDLDAEELARGDLLGQPPRPDDGPAARSLHLEHALAVERAEHRREQGFHLSCEVGPLQDVAERVGEPPAVVGSEGLGEGSELRHDAIGVRRDLGGALPAKRRAEFMSALASVVQALQKSTSV